MLLQNILATYLITGYVACEWKHQYGIPILGSEDPVIYGICAVSCQQLAESPSAAS